MIDAEQIRNIDGVSRALQYQDTVATPFLPAQRCLHSTPVGGNVRGRSLENSHNKRSRPARRYFHAHVPGSARVCPSRKAKGVRGRLVAVFLAPGAPAPSSGVVSPATTGDGGAWVHTQYSVLATPFLPAQRCLHSTPVGGNVRGRSSKTSHNKRSRPARRCFHAHVPGAARVCPSRKAKGVRGRLVAVFLTPGAPAPSSGAVSPATTGDGGAWVHTQYSVSCRSSGHCAVNCARGLS